MITTVRSLRDNASVALALARDRDLFLELLIAVIGRLGQTLITKTTFPCPSEQYTYISHRHMSECAI